MEPGSSDFGGVGIYDKAAIAFGYGQLIEIFDQRASNFVPTQWYNNLGLFDYDDLPYLFEGNANDPVYEQYRDAYDSYWAGDRTAYIKIKDIGLKSNFIPGPVTGVATRLASGNGIPPPGSPAPPPPSPNPNQAP